MNTQEVPDWMIDQSRAVPKLTPADIEALIVSEYYFTAEHGVEGAMARGELHAREALAIGNASLGHVTFCVLLLRNGAKVVGINHGPVSPKGFDAAYGRKDARAKAIEKVWELEGYALRERLAGNAAMAWQPIETAPRDGTVILAAESYYRDQHTVRPVISVVWLPDGEDAGWFNTGSFQRMVTFKPDIWMPIENPGRLEVG